MLQHCFDVWLESNMVLLVSERSEAFVSLARNVWKDPHEFGAPLPDCTVPAMTITKTL